jgi:hypothetical protein
LRDLAASDDGTLQGLVVRLHWRVSSDARFLCLAMGSLTAALSSLASLTQLSVEQDEGRTRATPGYLLDSKAKREAEAFARASPRLRYIRIYQRIFCVSRPGGQAWIEMIQDPAEVDVEIFREKIEPRALYVAPMILISILDGLPNPDLQIDRDIIIGGCWRWELA